MRWIISNGKDIAVDSNQIKARGEYIKRITGATVSDWGLIQANGKGYLYCVSYDGIDGTFITAHIGDVYKICLLKEVCTGKFIVANTCIWEGMSHKILLRSIREVNPNIELWFAKQELSVDANRVFRQSTTLQNFGSFGFQTSLSERELFRNRGKGFVEAISVSFDQVSPIILLSDFG